MTKIAATPIILYGTSSLVPEVYDLETWHTASGMPVTSTKCM